MIDTSSQRLAPWFRQVLLADLVLREAAAHGGAAASPPGGAVAVHVRRGDYAHHPQVFALCGEAYYAAAMERIRRALPGAPFLVFSDDIAAVRSGWDCFEGCRLVEGGTPIADFELMRRCDHQVIANSTFSWWAAYLNDNPAKRVIAPRVWFTDPLLQAEYEASRFVPAGWLRL